MNTLNWSHAKKVFYISAIALMMVSTVACSKGNKGKTSIRGPGHSRTTDWQHIIDPRTGQPMQQLGVITRNESFNGILSVFMYGLDPNALGEVSGQTGMWFHGLARNGEDIYLLIWDSIAAQSPNGEAFYWPLKVVDVRGDNRGATVRVEDNVGFVEFNGTITNGTWSGTVFFDNSKTDHASGTLGNFSIPAGAILQ